MGAAGGACGRGGDWSRTERKIRVGTLARKTSGALGSVYHLHRSVRCQRW